MNRTIKMTAARPNFPVSVCEIYMLAFVNGRCLILQGSSLLSLRNVCSFSVTLFGLTCGNCLSECQRLFLNCRDNQETERS